MHANGWVQPPIPLLLLPPPHRGHPRNRPGLREYEWGPPNQPLLKNWAASDWLSANDTQRMLSKQSHSTLCALHLSALRNQAPPIIKLCHGLAMRRRSAMCELSGGILTVGRAVDTLPDIHIVGADKLERRAFLRLL